MADSLVWALATQWDLEKVISVRTIYDYLLDHLVPLAGVTDLHRGEFSLTVFQRYYPIDFPNFQAILALSIKDKLGLFI